MKITQVDTVLNGNPKTLAVSIQYLPYGGIAGLTFGNGLLLNHPYDNQYRTSSIVIGTILNRTYTHDPNGNVFSIVDNIEPPGNEIFEDEGAYTYQQATNKLAQVEGELNVVYGYDANGNITSANNRTYTYNLSNQLVTLLDNGVPIAEYVYNGNSQRIKKTAQGGTRIFHYDLSGHLIAETTTTGQTLVEYFYLGDQPLAMIRPGEALYYYHNDHLGTPQILTDDTATVSWKAVYTPFGEAEITIGAVENPLRFPGQYYDQETGLHYNWHRYYDPKTGRYLTSDPIGLEGGINLFVYGDNSPLNIQDMFGLKGKTYVIKDVRITFYCNCNICTGKSPSDPGYGIAADGSKACDGTVAADKTIPFGSKVSFTLNGQTFNGVVHDRGGAIKGSRIDIWCSSHKEAVQKGTFTVDVTIMEP